MPFHIQNAPPEHGIRVPHQVMENFVQDLFLAVGTSKEHARHMAVALTTNDLRCVFSHGTQQTADYTLQMRLGHTNPRPQITVVSESDATAVLDGDGGLGYFPAHRGTEMAIKKALNVGVATVTTRNHFHFGAAGNYSRLALPHNCICMAISSHRFQPNPNASVMSATGGSPMSIAIPTENQPPLVLDMGAYILPRDENLMAQYPIAYFKSLGLGAVFQALGGMLAGIWNDGFQHSGQGEGAAPQQGAFIAVFDIRRFIDVPTFKQEMDRYIAQARSTKPLPGFDRAELAGGMEYIWEQDHRKIGIPVTDDHRSKLEKVAETIGVHAPFAQFEHTRF